MLFQIDVRSRKPWASPNLHASYQGALQRVDIFNTWESLSLLLIGPPLSHLWSDSRNCIYKLYLQPTIPVLINLI